MYCRLGTIARAQASTTARARCAGRRFACRWRPPPRDETARAACPLACGSCELDVCASSPCLNGGTCAQGRESATCKTSDLADRADAVARECCDEPTEDCSSGEPASCNPGCAAVLVPYYLDCREALRAESGEVLAAVQRVVQQCDSTPVYQCTCIAGYSGDNCEVGGRGVSRFATGLSTLLQPCSCCLAAVRVPACARNSLWIVPPPLGYCRPAHVCRSLSCRNFLDVSLAARPLVRAFVRLADYNHVCVHAGPSSNHRDRRVRRPLHLEQRGAL